MNTTQKRDISCESKGRIERIKRTFPIFRKQLSYFLLANLLVFFLYSCKTSSVAPTSSNVDIDTSVIGYAMVGESLLPMRGTPSELAEMYTELHRWGTCKIFKEEGGWAKINSNFDNSRGWVDRNMIIPLGKEVYDYYNSLVDSGDYTLVKTPIAYAQNQATQQTIPLTAGTRLLHYKDGTFEVLGEKYSIDPSQVLKDSLPITQENVQALAEPFLNIPYLWAGTGGFGLDCSGFTQVVCSFFGYILPHNSRLQSQKGQPVESFKDVQAGDLVFFGKNERISHVGIMWDKEHVIHCCGRVRIDEINEEGFLHPDGSRIVHLICIRRL